MLTCEEVNRALAERRGEILFDSPAYNKSAFQQIGEHWVKDYCHDWRWAGVLQEELLRGPDWKLRYLEGYWADPHPPWQVYEGTCEHITAMPVAYGETPTEAIARARLQMYEEEGQDA